MSSVVMTDSFAEARLRGWSWGSAALINTQIPNCPTPQLSLFPARRTLTGQLDQPAPDPPQDRRYILMQARRGAGTRYLASPNRTCWPWRKQHPLSSGSRSTVVCVSVSHYHVNDPDIELFFSATPFWQSTSEVRAQLCLCNLCSFLATTSCIWAFQIKSCYFKSHS